MRIKTWIIGLSLLSTVGCSSMNNTEKGMAGGALVGTGAGALIGRGNPAAMVLGGVVGTMVGGVAGNAQDARDDRKAWAQANANAQAAQAQRMVTVPEVIQLSQRGTHETLIINQINANGCQPITSNDIIDMQGQGVSPNVIAAMQQRGARPVVVAPARVIYDPYPPPYPPPPPPVGVGVAVGIR
jgi:hypothetical protein